MSNGFVIKKTAAVVVVRGAVGLKGSKMMFLSVDIERNIALVGLSDVTPNEIVVFVRIEVSGIDFYHADAPNE